MKKMSKLIKCLLLLVCLVPLIMSSGEPSEDDFKELKLLEQGPLSLSTKDGGKGEAYYKFSSSNVGKYMTARLSHMSKANLDIFYFREYADIRRNEKSFDGYIKMCEMPDKFECAMMGSGGSSSSHVFWIIVKLMNDGEIYEGGIQFFNEQDEIPLTVHKMWHIKKFYGLEQLYFGFTIPDNITDSYEIIVMNKIPNKRNKVALYKYEAGVPTKIDEQAETDDYLYEIDTPGQYRVQVFSDGVDDDSDVTVLLQKLSTKLNKAIKMELGGKYSVVGYEDRYFNYYVKLDGIQKNEENVATITLSQAIYGGAVKGIYSQVIATNDESAIEENFFPISAELNQFPVQAEFNDERVIHLYFYNNQVTPDNAYLLITLIYAPDPLTLPTEIDVAVSKKMQIIDLSASQQKEWLFYLNREEDVPISMRFNFTVQDPATYVFYFSNNFTVRYYEGDFIDYDDFNVYTHTESLFSFNNYQRDHQIESLSINFFGTAIGQFMRILKLTTNVDYYEVRNEKTITVTHYNTSVPYYYIADNEVTTAKYVHVEEIYGNCEIYYKTSIKDQTDPIFPTKDNQVDGKLIKVSGVADIFSVNCHFPGKFIMHFFGTENENLEVMNSKRWIYLPSSGYGCLNINFDISSINMLVYSPYQGQVDINRMEGDAISWTEKMNNGAKAVKARSFKSGNKLCLNATGTETVASISFSLDSEYLNVVSNMTLLSNHYLLYYLPENKDYSEVRFTLIGINTDFKYGLIKQKCSETDCDRYAPYLSNSGIDDKIDQEYLIADKYMFRLENPYDKKGSTSEYKYYLALELLNFDEREFTKYNISIKLMDRPDYTVVPPNQIAFIQEDVETGTTMEFVELEQTDDYKTRYVLIAQKTAPKFTQFVFQRNFYTDYAIFNVTDKYNVFYMNNLGVDTQLTAFFMATVPDDFNCIEMSYQFLKEGETFDEQAILKFNDLQLNITYTHNGTVLEWTEVENVSTYVVFVAQKDTIEFDKMENDCYLNGVYEAWKQRNGTMPIGFMLVNETTEPNQYYDASGEEYYVSVFAVMVKPAPMRLHYNTITIKDFDPTIPESSFKKVEPFAKTYFSLGLHIFEKYFTITTSDVTTDTIIKLIDPLSPNVVLYVFDDLYSIMRSPHGGIAYEGYIARYDLNGVMEIVHPGDKTKKGTKKFYLIFQNDQMMYDMTFWFFNEKDLIPLDDNDAYYFDNMYSLNELSFTFTSFPNETTECIFKSQYSYVEQVITIYKRHKESAVESWEEIKKSEGQTLNYVVEKSNNGLFKITIKSKNPSTASTARRIISIRQKSWEVFLIGEDSLYKDILVDPRVLYFRVDLDSWAKDEENMLTIYQNPDFEDNSVTYWTKIVNCEDKESEIVKLMPKSANESEFFVDRNPDIENYYHIPFKKTKAKVTGQKTFLLITVTFKTEKSFFAPRNLTIAASERVEELSISSLVPEFQHLDDTRLKNYIPKITRYTLASNDNNTYLVFVNSPNASTFYYGNLIDSTGHLSENSAHTSFYSFTNGDEGKESPKTSSFYVVYMQEEKVFETLTLKTQSKAKILPDKIRSVQDIEVEITNCDRGFVLTGSYTEKKSTAYAYIEQIYGSFNFYYKGFLNYDDKEQEIMPGEDYKVGYFFDLGEEMDILKITCTYPGKILLHLLDKASTIQPDERNYFFLPAGEIITKTLPVGDGLDIELSNHLSANVSGMCNGILYEISPMKIRESWHFAKVGLGSTIDMISNIDTVVMLNYIDSEHMYRVLDSDVKNVSDRYFLVYLPASRKDYAELRIDVKKLEHDIYYIFGRCNADNEPEYIPAARFGTRVPISTLYGKILHKVIDNPSDKQNSTTYNHFIAFFMGDGTVGRYDIDITYMTKPTFDDLETEDIGYINEYPHVSFYESLQIQKKNAKYYTFAAHKCGIKSQQLFVKNYYTTYSTYQVTNTYHGYTFRNIGNVIQVTGNFAATLPAEMTGFEFSYSTSDEPNTQLISDIEQFNSKVILRAHLGTDNRTVTWDETYKERVLSYDLYAIDKTIDPNLLTNDCFLYSQQQTYNMTGELPKYFYAIKSYSKNDPLKFVIDYNRNSYIAIVATMTLGLHIRVNFEVLVADIQNEPIPEEWFTYLMPHSETFMSLSKTSDEDYYKFDSSGLNFDNIFRVNEGLYVPEGNIEIYWYPSTASIIVDKERHFSGYLGKNKLEEGKIDYVLEHNPTAPATKQTLYVVIKNIGQTNFNSKISLYNENDKYNMGAYETRLISTFFYTKTLTFGFSTSIGDVVEFSIKNQDEKNTHMIEFYELLDGEYKLVENTTDSEYHKEFKEDDSGYFMVKIKSDKPAYEPVKKLVSFQRTQGELIDLNEGELFEYAPVSTRLFRFKYIMDGYEMNDEGVASVYIPYIYTQSKAFKGIYSKVVSFKADYEDYEKDLVKLSPSTPKESQFDYEPTENFDNYYFVYFKKKMREATGETLFLLLTVEFYIAEDFFDPNTFNVVVGYKSDKIDLRKKDYPTNVEVTDSFFISDFVPRLVTYLLPDNLEDTSSFALWFSEPNIAVIYEGTLLNQDEINQKKTQYQLFSTSNHPRVSKGKTTQVTLKLFGLSAYAFARRLISPQPIINISGERIDQTRNITLTNCESPLTLMGQYSAGIMGWLTTETLYGQFTFYYKGQFTDGDASAYILPKFTDIIQDEVAKLSSYYDVLTISCTRPGKLFIHIFDELYPINKDGMSRMRLLANKQATLLLPAGNINVYAETSTKDATIKMTYITMTQTFDSNNPLYYNLTSVVASSALFFTSNIDAVISVNTIGTPDLFTEVKAPSSVEMTKENIVFLLPIDNATADSTLTFEGMKYPLYYSHIQTDGKWAYFPKPEFSGFSHNLIYPDEKGKIEISVGNIYDKYEHTSKKYAIGVSIKPQVGNDVPAYKLSVVNSQKGTYHALKPDVIGVISNNQDDYFYKQAQIDNSKDPDAYYFVTAHECGSQIQALQTFNYREPLDSYDILHDVSFISFKNYLMDVQLATNTSASTTEVNGLEVSYYIIQNSLDHLYVMDILNKRRKKLEEDIKNDVVYKIKFNRYKGVFTWSDYDQANDYEFHLMRQKTVSKNLANNDCYLLSAEQHYSIDGSLPDGFELIQNVPASSPTVTYKVDDTIAYYAAVTARVVPPLPIRMEFRVLSIPIYEPIIPDENWKVLTPFDPYRLALSLHKTDEFFRFDNQNNQTDVVFRVQEGMYLEDTKIDIFFYDEVRKIERDEDGNYLNAIVSFTMKQGQTDYILKHNEFTAKTMYVIVKNYNMTAYSSDIIMWNEKDVKTLIEDNPFVINQFLSTQTYVFNFTTYLDEVVDVVVTNELSTNTHTITLVETTNGTEKTIETSKNNTFRHHFKEDDYGEFRLTITNEMEPYKQVRKVVQLEKSQGEFDDLLPNIPMTMSLLVTRPFYFKYVLNDYKYNELGIVTLYLTFEIAGLYKGFYGKVVVAEDNETALFPMAPKSEADNEFFVEKHPDGEHYHIHFKNNKKPEDGKPCILLLTVDLEEGYSFFTPREFVVSLSEKEEKVDLGDLAFNVETDYSYYVPSDTAKMVTFSYYVGEKQAMIFLSPGETVCTFYNGSYISPDGKEINEDINDNLLFAIPTNPSAFNNGAYIQTISVKFFGPTARYHLKLVRVKGNVVFREGVRQENSIPFEITDCSEPSYYIESYDTASTAYTYIQLDYGKADFYYRGDYSTHEREFILPTIADQVYNVFTSLGEELYSLLKIECIYPVRGELHVFDNIYENPLMSNARYRFFVGDLFYEYNLPPSRPLYITAETPLSQDIMIYLDDSTTYTIEKGTPLTIILDDYRGENKISFFGFSDSYMEVSIVGDPYQYEEVSEGSHQQLSYKNLVAYVPVDGIKNKLTSYTFKMTNVYQDFIYSFMKTVENDRYFLPLPSKSGYSNQVVRADMLRNHQFTAFVGGIFDKVDPDTDSFAFVIEFIDNTTNTTNVTKVSRDAVYPYNVEVKFNRKMDYPIVNKEQLGYLSTVKSDLEYTTLELEDPKDRNEQYIFFTFFFSGNKLDHIYFMNFENTMKDIDPMDTYSTYYIKNPMMYLQLEIGFMDKPSKIVPHSGMGFSFYFTDTIDEDFVKFVNELNIKKEKLSVKNNKITWKKISEEYKVDYEIFLFESGALDASELKNEMFVTHARKTSDPKLKSTSSLGDKDNYTVKEKGKFDAVVIAQINGPCPIRYIYEYHSVTGTGSGSSIWWIILIIVLAVAAIAAGVIYFIMNKRKRDVILPTNYDPLMGSINQ